MALPPAYEDHIDGACLHLNGIAILVLGPEWETANLPDEVLLSGDLALFYALPFQDEDDALVPQSVFDDHQVEHSGRDLLAFVSRRGHAYPRADVAGMRLTGDQDEVRLREFDLAAPFVVLAASRTSSDLPVVRVEVCVTLSTTANGEGLQTIEEDNTPDELPDLLVQHVPCYQLPLARAVELADLLETQVAGSS